MKTANICKITTKTGAAAMAALLLTAVIAGCACGCSKKKANEIKDEYGLVLSGKMPDGLALKEIELHNYYVERNAGQKSFEEVAQIINDRAQKVLDERK